MAPLTMRDIFTSCQDGLQNHAKYVKNLINIYHKTTLEEFWPEFLHHLKHNLIVFKRYPAVERTMEFIARFATTLAGATEDMEEKDTNQDDEDEEEVEMHPFLMKIFDFLLKSHRANDKAVRFRVCQLLNKMLSNMGEGAQIDDDLYDRIYDCIMKERLRDVVPLVRAHAVLAVSRLQDPNDQNCPVIQAYLPMMKYDSSAETRRNVLSVIAASTKTLSAILERTHDVDESIRKKAYYVIAEKVNIRALTISQRVKLLQKGLTDRAEGVREACVSQLLQAWLRTYQGNVLELLACFDVENSPDSLKTSELALSTMMKKSQVNELIQKFDILNDQLVVAPESLSPESVLYWRCLCKHLSSLGTEGESHLDKVLPTVTVFSNFVWSTYESMKVDNDLDAQLRNEFILQQLLSLATVLDLSDEAGRKQFGKMLRELLQEEGVAHTLVKPLVACYERYQPDPNRRVAELIEVISDIREPITTVETGMNAEDRRHADLKLARIRVELNQLRDELDQCVDKQEFSRASEVKARITELDGLKQTLLDDSKPQSQEVRKEKTDPQTLLKCMTIACEMQEDPKVCQLSAALRTLIEVLILPGVQSEDSAVRNTAVRALGMSCLLSCDLASDHLLLFMQVCHMDIECIRVTALQVLFDFVLYFGLDAFEDKDADADADAETDEPQDTSTDKLSDTTSEMNESGASEFTDKNAEKGKNGSKVMNKVMNVLINLLDSESSEVRTVVAEGLCKLLLASRVVSSKLVSRLLLLWYNPITEDDTYLRHCLGTFFPMYAFSSRVSLEVMEEAFMPTLNTLFEAPATSPLAEINADNVSELLVQLTNSRHLPNNNNNNQPASREVDNSIHCSIAIKVCNSILSDPRSFSINTLCKILNKLELDNSAPTSLADLGVLADRMMKAVKDKRCLRMLEKFQRTIKELLKATELANDSAADGISDNDEMSQLTRKLEETQVETGADVNTTLAGSRQRKNSRRLGDPSKSFLSGDEGRRVRSTAAGRVSSKSSSSESDDEDMEGDGNRPRRTGSELENSVFDTPTPLRDTARGRRAQAAGIALTRKNLDELLSDTDDQSEPETVTTPAKRPTRSTRVTRQSRIPLGDIDNEVP